MDLAEDWDFYLCEVSGKWASMYLDLNRAGQAPDPTRTVLAFVRLSMLAPRPDGLSSAEEFDRLVAIEEALVPTIQNATDGTYVGRCTTNSSRDYFFYVAERTGFDQAVAEAAREFPEYRYEIISGDEPQWETYFNYLFPAPTDRQRILNRRVCESLVKHGDALTEPRPTAHWSYFDSVANRDAFVAEVQQLGFVQCGSIDPSDTQPRHGVQIIRDDIPARDKIDDITLRVLDATNRHGGEYDGWETKVLTSDEA